MRRIEESIVINRPCDEVFNYLANRAHDPEWMVSVLESQWLDPGEPGSTEPASVGRRGRMVMKVPGRRVEFIDEVTDYQAGRVVAHKTVEGPFPLNTACRCDPTPGGCRATVVGEFDRPIGGVFAPLVEPFIARGVRRGFKADLVELKKILEAQAHQVRE
ncbi:MAG TPA: SRPBCC family protein [Jiangellaceae bacterium]